MISRGERWLARFATPEVLTFLTVGGVGYVVDVGAFNLLRSAGSLATLDPSYARVLAVGLAMLVTYLGNRMLTWRGQAGADRRREVTLFVVFNLIGLGFSVLALVVSHDLMGLTGRWADNISANVIGLGLGTVFRFWSYRRFVFTGPATAAASMAAVRLADRDQLREPSVASTGTISSVGR